MSLLASRALLRCTRVCGSVGRPVAARSASTRRLRLSPLGARLLPSAATTSPGRACSDAHAVQVQAPRCSRRFSVQSSLMEKVRQRDDALRSLAQRSKFGLAELKALHSQFTRRASADGVSETMSLAEFRTTMRKLGVMDESRVKAYFTAFDLDRDGELTFAEFITGLSTVLRGSAAELVNFEFAVWDSDSDGRINLDEFGRYLRASGRLDRIPDNAATALVDHLFRTLDVNGSGTLDVDEFKTGILRGDIAVSTLDLANLRPSDSDTGASQLTPAEHEVLLFLGEQIVVPAGSRIDRNERCFYYLQSGEAQLVICSATLDGRGVAEADDSDDYDTDSGYSDPGAGDDLAGFDRREFDPTTPVLDVLTVRPGPEAFLGDKEMFSGSFDGEVVLAKTEARVLRVHAEDILALVYNGHPGVVSLLTRLGKLMVHRLGAVDDVIRAAYGGTLPEEWAFHRQTLLQEWSLRYHSLGKKGKVEVVPTKQIGTPSDFSIVYSPGVAEPCLAIKARPALAYEYTAKGRLVGLITNGSGVLGLGNVGAVASKPVMEGKAVLFKEFADLDAFDIELDVSDAAKFIDTVVAMAPTFGAISLAHIAAPACFAVEEGCQARLSIPVLHDDQHGTAIVVAAAVLNGLHVAGKAVADARVVISGTGAGAVATFRHLQNLGFPSDHLVVFDKAGVVHAERVDIAGNPGTHLHMLCGAPGATVPASVTEAMDGADVFIGLPHAAALPLPPSHLAAMAVDPVVITLGMPTPEIDYDTARRTRPDAILATGRSDIPNHVNSVCAFPYVFRGAMDSRARHINTEMKVAATLALVDVVREHPGPMFDATRGVTTPHCGRDYIVPRPFDPQATRHRSPKIIQRPVSRGHSMSSSIEKSRLVRQQQQQ